MPNRVLLIGEEWHRALQFLRNARSNAYAKQVTLKGLVEDALTQVYGDRTELLRQLDESRDPSILPAILDDAAIFTKITNAALSHRDTDDYIEQLSDDFMTCDHMGRPNRLRVKDLAYYLRETHSRIGCLQDLRIAYAFAQ